jgi:histone H3/H4
MLKAKTLRTYAKAEVHPIRVSGPFIDTLIEHVTATCIHPIVQDMSLAVHRVTEQDMLTICRKHMGPTVNSPSHHSNLNMELVPLHALRQEIRRTAREVVDLKAIHILQAALTVQIDRWIRACAIVAVGNNRVTLIASDIATVRDVRNLF